MTEVNGSGNGIFKSKAKERYKIEAKNRELKTDMGKNCVIVRSYWYGNGVINIFAVNLKRIVKLMGENNQIQHIIQQ